MGKYTVYKIDTGEPVFLTHYVDVLEHVKSGRFVPEKPTDVTKEVKPEADVKEAITVSEDPVVIPDVAELEIPDQQLDVTVDEVVIPQASEEVKDDSPTVKVSKRTR